MTSFPTYSFCCLIQLALASLIHALSINSSPFTISCDLVDPSKGCLIEFPGGNKTKLWHFTEEKQNVQVLHYICVCPNWQHNGMKPRICMLNEEEVQTEFERTHPRQSGSISNYAQGVNKYFLNSAIYTKGDNCMSIQAIEFTTVSPMSLLIWRNASNNGEDGCTAMPVDGTNIVEMKQAFVDHQNGRMLKATQVHACPLTKVPGHFGCLRQHIFIIDEEEDIHLLALMTHPDHQLKYSWTFGEVFLHFLPNALDYPNMEKPSDLIISPSDDAQLNKISHDQVGMKKYMSYKCSYARDFVQILEFRKTVTQKIVGTVGKHKATLAVGATMCALGYALGCMRNY